MMNLREKATRARAFLALGLCLALIGGVAAAGADGRADLAKPGPIKSGAGPGWPATLSPSDFVSRVDNRWFPLKPGSRYRYKGVDGDDKTVDVVRVTHKTRRILGVETTIVHDVVSIGGKPDEKTNDYYAQDRHDNVWYFGEATRTLDKHGNTISKEGSFQAGRDGARVGVLIPGHPKVGQTGRQEYLKGEAEDQFKVLDLDARVATPFVSSHHALRTKETTPLEPNVVDNKYYVRGVGTVREVTVKGPTERLKLVSLKKG